MARDDATENTSFDRATVGQAKRRDADGPLIAVRDATLAFGRRAVLSNISLVIAPGEIVTIVGPNGGGKTTLLRAVIGDLAPSSGAIARRADLRIGYVPQRLAIDRALPMTVSSFLRLADGANREQRRAALGRVGATNIIDASMADLSGGELQRALLARALLRQPHLLVLDEPTQGLDQSGGAALYRLIERLRRDDDVAVLMVSHELHVVMAASDRVICVNGHICCQGAPAEVSSDPAYQKLFGGAEADALALYRHRHDHTH